MIEPQGLRWYAIQVNPEPWEIGPLSVLRRNQKLIPHAAPSQQLLTYKAAIREVLESQYPNEWSCILPGLYNLAFYFWRNTERGNYADATNLQKSTEDALQGILLSNDRDVLRVSSIVVEQGPNVTGAVVFRIEWGIRREQLDYTEAIPADILAVLDQYRDLEEARSSDDNTWPPK